MSNEDMKAVAQAAGMRAVAKQHEPTADTQPDIKTIKRNLSQKYAGRIVKFSKSGDKYQMQGDGSIRRLDGQRRRNKRTFGEHPKDTRSERQKRREEVGHGK